MTIRDLIDIVGLDTFINELENWMPTDELEDFINDVKNDFDIEEE